MSELERIHRHFSHPHPDRLFAVLQRASEPHATLATRSKLKELSKAFQVRQRLAPASSRFRVSLPQDIVLNRTVSLDIMYLTGPPLLQVIDMDTMMSAASFLQAETVEAVWGVYTRI